MKVLIIGGGAREHSLLTRYSKSKKIKKLYSVPGNGLMDYKADKEVRTYPEIKPIDKNSIWEIVAEEKIDLVDVAQDDLLAQGLVDFLTEKGVATFGPTKKAAQLEWSKAWSRNFMKKYYLPTPHFAIFTSPNEAKDYLKKLPEGSFFVKASGLAAGKGAIKAQNKKEAVEAIEKMKEFGSAGQTFLIEECLYGEEVSIWLRAID